MKAVLEKKAAKYLERLNEPVKRDMNTTIFAVRKELHTLIDNLPERKLNALRPLFDVLVDEEIIIETDLTEEEKTIIAEGDIHYTEHPEDFVPLESIK